MIVNIWLESLICGASFNGGLLSRKKTELVTKKNSALEKFKYNAWWFGSKFRANKSEEDCKAEVEVILTTPEDGTMALVTKKFEWSHSKHGAATPEDNSTKEVASILNEDEQPGQAEVNDVIEIVEDSPSPITNVVQDSAKAFPKKCGAASGKLWFEPIERWRVLREYSVYFWKDIHIKQKIYNI